MKKIRELIETKLENAKLDLANKHYSNKDGLIGNIEAYQDLLALIPKPRREQEILKEFEKLGYEVNKNNEDVLVLTQDFGYETGFEYVIKVYKLEQEYEKKLYTDKVCGCEISFQEHKLLNELFSLWGWI